MPKGQKTCSDEEFIALFKEYGPTRTAKLLGAPERSVYRRRDSIERALGIKLSTPGNKSKRRDTEYPQRVEVKIQDGVVMIGSDHHYWPDEISPAHRGFCILAKRLKPKIVLINGDAFDGARISRHPPIGWSNPPSLIDELLAVEARTDEIRKAAPGAALYWTIGNHDARFENKLALQAPEFAQVRGFALKDHFPHWKFCWSLWINDDVVVKHRFKGGVHATHNNTLNAGKSMFTGHLHSLKVTPFNDYNGTRFGGDSGTMANPYGPQFEYAEANPLNHRSGFLVLTFKNGKLLWPEIAAVIDEDHIQFRGEVIKV